jgi:hypothetical protein
MWYHRHIANHSYPRVDVDMIAEAFANKGTNNNNDDDDNDDNDDDNDDELPIDIDLKQFERHSSCLTELRIVEIPFCTSFIIANKNPEL